MGRNGKNSGPRPVASEAARSVFGVRLLALPRDVLRTVLHLAGRPVRCACRALHDGYGPLDGGLCLEHLGDLVPTSSPGGYHSIHTLILRPHPSTTRVAYALLRPLAVTFPALRTLHLDAPITLNHSLVQYLAPLGPCLTSLTAAFGNLTSLAALATTLTSLCELGLNNVACAISDALSTLRPLAPALLRLSCTARTASSGTAAEALRSLAPFTSLTHLVLPASATDFWDQEGAELLATALPCLQALKFEYYDRDSPDNPRLADDIWAALGRRTALTTLATVCSQLPSGAPPLRLAQLSLVAISHNTSHGIVSLLEALAPSHTLTRLEVTSLVSPICPFVNALCLLADTLQSLSLNGCPAPLPALLPLSQLTRLESLALNVAAPRSADGHVTGEQAASAIAAALPRLTSLQLLPERSVSSPTHHLAALVEAVARQGTLRHLALGCWDLQWGSSLLAPLATTLARLTLPAQPDNVLHVVESVAGMRALLCLCLQSAEPTAVLAGGVPLPGQAAVDGRQHAGREHPAEQGNAAGQGEAGALQVQLPLGLRQLCLEKRKLVGVKWRLEARVMAALLAAAARQDCVVRMDGAQPPLSSVRLPQHDDCHGYRDGASAEWVEARRLQQKEKRLPGGTLDS